MPLFSRGNSLIDLLPALFVTGTWAVMTAAMVFYVHAFGSSLPFFDDLAVLADLTPGRAPTINELFAPQNDHLIPFGRFAYWLSWTACNGSVRPMLFAQAGVLALTCLWVNLRMRSDRGSFDFDDVLIPLALLAAGHWSQVIWAICLAAVVGTGIISILIVNLMRTPQTLSNRNFAALALVILVLAYQSAGGLLLAIGLLPFLTLLVITRLRQSVRYSYAIATMVITLGLVLLLAFVAQLGRPGASIDNTTSVLDKLRAIFQALAMCFGGLGRAAWPFAGCITFLVEAITVVALLRHDTDSLRRFDNASLLRVSLFIPPLLLTAGLAAGRARGGAFAPHYFFNQIPHWVAIAAAWANMPKSLLNTFLLRIPVLLLAVAFGLDFRTALLFGKQRREQTALLQRDLESGAHADRVAAMHSAYWDSGKLLAYQSQLTAIATLKKGPIGQLDCTPSFDFIDLPLDRWVSSNATRNNEEWSVNEQSKMFYRFDRQFDSVRITFEVRSGWTANMAISPIVDALPAWSQEIPARHEITLRNPVTQHFVFAKRADGFILLPNDTPSAFKIIRLEGGLNRP